MGSDLRDDNRRLTPHSVRFPETHTTKSCASPCSFGAGRAYRAIINLRLYARYTQPVCLALNGSSQRRVLPFDPAPVTLRPSKGSRLAGEGENPSQQRVRPIAEPRSRAQHPAVEMLVHHTTGQRTAGQAKHPVPETFGHGTGRCMKIDFRAKGSERFNAA